MNSLMDKLKYLIVFVALIILGFIYYLTRSKSTLDDEFDVAIDSEDIVEFKLSDPQDTLHFELLNDKWVFNQQLNASDLKVNGMIELLKSVSVKNPITGTKGEDLKQLIIKSGVQVKVGDQSLYFISKPLDLNGDFVYKTGYKYVGQLNQITGINELQAFLSTDKAQWISKSIFNVKSEDVESIEVIWSNATNSFEIQKDDLGQFVLLSNGRYVEKADKNKIKYYTYEFGDIQLASKGDKYKAVAGELECEIVLKTNSNQITSATFYKLVSNDGNVDRNNLIVHHKEANSWGKISYVKMSPCFKKIDFFYKE